ncbi:hypothetical protein HanPSC8_Chr15g0653621 [Helianthus annuus]|nr:hypothetical protein HanPSC8_Chr15g0653621 [Helianthus annuus]
MFMTYEKGRTKRPLSNLLKHFVLVHVASSALQLWRLEDSYPNHAFNKMDPVNLKRKLKRSNEERLKMKTI